MEHELVFKALGDVSRRKLLDPERGRLQIDSYTRRSRGGKSDDGRYIQRLVGNSFGS